MALAASAVAVPGASVGVASTVVEARTVVVATLVADDNGENREGHTMEELDTPTRPQSDVANATKVLAAPPRTPSLTQVVHTIFSRDQESDERKTVAGRRRFVMAAILGTLGVNFLMFLRFFFPRVLYEPATKFKIGYPSDFGFGVDTKFQSKDASGWYATRRASL